MALLRVARPHAARLGVCFHVGSQCLDPQAWHDAMAQLNSALAQVKGRVGNAGALYDTYEAQQTSDLDSVMASAAWDSTKFSG